MWFKCFDMWRVTSGFLDPSLWVLWLEHGFVCAFPEDCFWNQRSFQMLVSYLSSSSSRIHSFELGKEGIMCFIANIPDYELFLPYLSNIMWVSLMCWRSRFFTLLLDVTVSIVTRQICDFTNSMPHRFMIHCCLLVLQWFPCYRLATARDTAVFVRIWNDKVVSIVESCRPRSFVISDQIAKTNSGSRRRGVEATLCIPYFSEVRSSDSLYPSVYHVFWNDSRNSSIILQLMVTLNGGDPHLVCVSTTFFYLPCQEQLLVGCLTISG
jgi:hypothetical protein